MPYADKDYFLTKIKLSELNLMLQDNSGTPNEDYLTSAIADADDIINNYLRKASKVVPLSPVPKSIRLYSYFIATYFLVERISPNDIPERVKNNYDLAMNGLKDIAANKSDLEGIPVADIETSVYFEGETPVMTKNSF